MEQFPRTYKSVSISFREPKKAVEQFPRTNGQKIRGSRELVNNETSIRINAANAADERSCKATQRIRRGGVISLKALDFRAFAGLEEKQLRGAESSVETYPKLSSDKP